MKSTLFKKTRKSVIRKLSNPYYKRHIECFDYSCLTTLELIYILFHFKEINKILDSWFVAKNNHVGTSHMYPNETIN